MRWRTGSSTSEMAAASAGSEPAALLDAKQPEAEQLEAASTSASPSTPSSSSPLVGNGQSAAADSSVSASSLISSSNATSNSGASSSPLVEQATDGDLDPAADSVSSSAIDPDGDPPYKRSQQSQRQALQSQSAKAGGSGSGGSNDEDDMDGLPALEAVNPDDGDDDVDDDTGDDHEVPWKPQATQSTCEFTHTITNYSQKRDSGCKKAEYSATTVDEFGNRWRLIVYVNGNGRASNHHLSLFLQVADADDLPFGWKKAVSYVLTLEHPTGPNLSYAKRNPDKTFKLCPKAIDWGWSQFITSDRIQQEGFVQNDSLVVRASVTVKSSSVSIDLEDAELYLKCAVEEGKPEAVQLCLDQGASVNCQFKDDLYTPLHTACSTSTGDDDDDEEEDEDDDDEDEDDDSDNGRGDAGHKKNRNHTANSGSMRVLQLLLEKGADGNACNKWRETPLLIAANNGHRSAVEALLKHGADPGLCSEAGWSALTFAAHKGYDDIVQLLLKDGAPVNCRVTEDASTPLHKACAGSKPGHLAAVKLLLANNADVHALNKWRETPLLTAANHGQAGAVEALLKAGADPCKCTDTGWSPLSIAAYKGHDDVVKLLLEEGAPTEEEDPTLSALLQAATKGLPDTVELLLKHGADHTVTTKKGDTALSILVEQNLIDAAVDMVTEYNASIPRCSRDRKKVQRARLLINLRIKQRQREGKDISLVDSDGDDEINRGDENIVASMVESEAARVESEKETASGQGGSGSKPKKKNKKKKASAEQEAKAAEKALLLELELEDAERQKQEQEASKKSAKKRKKKERERQQKKEQEEKRLAEERDREEKLRKEREEKEAKERAERERLLAQKRKEEEDARKRLLEKQKIEQQQREEQRKKELQKKNAAQPETTPSNHGASTNDKKLKSALTKPPRRQPNTTATAVPPRQVTGAHVAPQAARQNQSKSAVATAAKSQAATAPSAPKPIGKNRGWETKPVVPSAVPTAASETKQTPPKPIVAPISSGSNTSSAAAPATLSSFLTPQRDVPQQSELFSSASPSSPFAAFGSDLMNPPAPMPMSNTKSEPILNGFSPSLFTEKGIDVPAVALFRRNKVSELLQRCAMARSASAALGAIDEATIKKVLYRWMVRAAHESTSFLDCVIPSWTDFEKLTAFFQRQFISENRKGMNAPAAAYSLVSMEALKEAGSTIALLCHNLAKEVAEFRGRMEDQLQPDWNDGIIGMKASETMRNGSGHPASIVLDWADRAQVLVSGLLFNKLRERYTGLPGRFLSSVFSAQIRYETQQLITVDTMMDFILPSATLSTLSMKAGVTAEVWCDPMSATSGNIFWGQFVDVDAAFGGIAPFSSNEGSDEVLLRHGGAVVITVPLDNMVASRYIHRMIDLLDLAENGRVGLSFIAFLRAECFLDGRANPTFGDLCTLEPRLRDRTDIVSRVDELAPLQHVFLNKTNGVLQDSSSGSLFVILQNNTGKSHHVFSDRLVSEVLRSMRRSSDFSSSSREEPSIPIMSEMSFSAPEFVPAASRAKNFLVGGVHGSNFFQHPQAPPVSPLPNQSNLLPDFGAPISGDFGGFGGSSIGGAFSNASHGGRSSRPARGRLFDLVDDGGEDDHGTADVVSGMLGNLNMDDLFSHQPNNHNSNGEIDIEAISLMGIGGPSTGSSSSIGGLQPRRSHFGY